MNILERLNIETENLVLYEEAVTHTSYTNEHNLNYDYEKLEFLGDAIVDFIVSEYLYLNYNESEGIMTKKRANFVCEAALYDYALKIKLDQEIRIGKGENNHNKTIIADIFEAFIGALYLDQGFDKTKAIVLEIIIPFIETNVYFLRDYKSELQEYVQTSKKSVIYELANEKGPAHNRTFVVNVKVGDIILGVGVGSSKKEAEQNAAKSALEKKA